MIPNEASMVRNEAWMLQNEAWMVQNEAWMLQNEAWMVRNEAWMVRNEASMLRNEAWMVRNEASMVRNEASMLRNEAWMVRNEAWMMMRARCLPAALSALGVVCLRRRLRAARGRFGSRCAKHAHAEGRQHAKRRLAIFGGVGFRHFNPSLLKASQIGMKFVTNKKGSSALSLCPGS
jgi:hypothetical protein